MSELRLDNGLHGFPDLPIPAFPGPVLPNAVATMDDGPRQSDFPSGRSELGQAVMGLIDPTGLVPVGGWPKRLTDIAISLAALILAAPIMVMLAVLVRAASRGPVFFAHTRVGFQGKPFKCYKFRTMVADADRVLQSCLAENPLAAAEWKATQKLRNDPRVNFVGQLLRRSSLDELPQLYNVLRGQMSCVGPRPVIRDELERYGSHADFYLRARPGLTGSWQVTGRSTADYSQRVALDVQYVRDWSFWTDLLILSRTPIAVTRLSDVC